MTPSTEILNGTCRQLLFSPKGGIEGVLLGMGRKTVQVVLSAPQGAALSRMCSVGKRLKLLALPDHSPKTALAVHPVYSFESLADSACRPVEFPDAEPSSVTVTGVVVALQFARHGQPNGVVLESGEFMHLRPAGMAETGLEVGSRVRAVGRARVTLFNTRWLDAHHVNGIACH